MPIKDPARVAALLDVVTNIAVNHPQFAALRSEAEHELKSHNEEVKKDAHARMKAEKQKADEAAAKQQAEEAAKAQKAEADETPTISRRLVPEESE